MQTLLLSIATLFAALALVYLARLYNHWQECARMLKNGKPSYFPHNVIDYQIDGAFDLAGRNACCRRSLFVGAFVFVVSLEVNLC